MVTNSHYTVTTMKITSRVYLITTILLASTLLIECEDNIDSKTEIKHELPLFPTEPFDDHFNDLEHLDDLEDLNSITKFHTNVLQSSDLSKPNLNSNKNNKYIRSVEVVHHNGNSITKYETTSHNDQDKDNDIYTLVPSLQSYNKPAGSKFTKIIKTVIKRTNNDGDNSNESGESINDEYDGNDSKEIRFGIDNSISKSQATSNENYIKSNSIPSIPIQRVPDFSSNLNNMMQTTATKSTTIGKESNDLNKSINSDNDKLVSIPQNKVFSTKSSSNQNYNDLSTTSLLPTVLNEDNKMNKNTKTTQINVNDIPSKLISHNNPDRGSYRRVMTTIIRHQNLKDDNELINDDIRSLKNIPSTVNPSSKTTINRDHSTNYYNDVNNGNPSRIQIYQLNKSNNQENSLSKSKLITPEMNYDSNDLLSLSRQKLSPNSDSFGEIKTTTISDTNSNEDTSHNSLDEHSVGIDNGNTKSSNNIVSTTVLPVYNQLQSTTTLNKENTNNNSNDIIKGYPRKKQFNKSNKYTIKKNLLSAPKTSSEIQKNYSNDLFKQSSNLGSLTKTITTVVHHDDDDDDNNNYDFRNGLNNQMLEYKIIGTSPLNTGRDSKYILSSDRYNSNIKNDNSNNLSVGGSRSESYLIETNGNKINNEWNRKGKNKNKSNRMRSVQGTMLNNNLVQNTSMKNRNEKLRGRKRSMNISSRSSPRRNKGSQGYLSSKYEIKSLPESSFSAQSYSHGSSVDQKHTSCGCNEKRKLKKRSSESNANDQSFENYESNESYPLMGPSPPPKFMSKHFGHGKQIYFKGMRPPRPPKFMDRQFGHGKQMNFEGMRLPPPPEFMDTQSQYGEQMDSEGMRPPRPPKFMDSHFEHGKRVDFEGMRLPPSPEFMDVQSEYDKKMGPPPPSKFMNKQSNDIDMRLHEIQNFDDNNDSNFKETDTINLESMATDSQNNVMSNNINGQNMKFTETIKTNGIVESNNAPIKHVIKTQSITSDIDGNSHINLDELNSEDTHDSSSWEYSYSDE